ncbi:cytochrome c oxidase assembly factor 3 homolog, mitochondrial isoform X1 [Oryzias melastigma]|uniref:cytochrome c oxidase assembly factor 3 homolog, mitochondrial isoform X1 n=1 Tax=Oryzias melastigma TaxID=30732 RepID=UPI00168D2A58|nr:cytochrome c oxidase assembly factor 3 homolog, mitochondrial isoform X1 [Oryzias melastigma]
MADSKPPKTEAPVATRIDPTKEGLSREQMHFIRQVEMEQWKKKTSKLRTRNVVTGLAIGAIVLGICILPMNTRGKRKLCRWRLMKVWSLVKGILPDGDHLMR